MMSPELVTAALKMIGVLVAIIGGLLFLSLYLKRFLKNGVAGLGSKSLQILESAPLGLKKSLTLVKVPGAVLVLGITPDRITLLDRLDGQVYAELSERQTPPATPTFQDHLRKVTGLWQSGRAPADEAASMESTPC
jgi:flagellar biosynthetic protein FliO